MTTEQSECGNDFNFGDHVIAWDNENDKERRGRYVGYAIYGGIKRYQIVEDNDHELSEYDQCKHDPNYFRNGEEVEFLHPETNKWVTGRFVGHDESNPSKCNLVVAYGTDTVYCYRPDIRKPKSIEQKQIPKWLGNMTLRELAQAYEKVKGEQQ